MQVGINHTGLGFFHGGVGICFGGRVVVSLSSFVIANFALVFTLLGLCGMQVVALVAAKAKVGAGARTLLRLLVRRLNWGRHLHQVPSFVAGMEHRLLLQRGWWADTAGQAQRQWTLGDWRARWTRCDVIPAQERAVDSGSWSLMIR